LEGTRVSGHDYYKQVGKDAEFVYSGSFWETGLGYPGNREFVAAYENEFNRAPAVQSAASYAGCRLLVDAISAAGGLESDKLRGVLLALRTMTVLGDFAVDDRGFQIAHKAPFSGRMGRKPSYGQMKSPQQRHGSQCRPGLSVVRWFATV
jgi:branched-chain amino acid transport system substrate-binding protein